MPTVLAAMRAVPRHEFVPAEFRPYAYLDTTLPIGEQQTISPPFIVGWMTAQLDPRPTDVVLEIGTGSGYQAAILSQLVKDVYTIEIKEPLAKRAQQTLTRLGYTNVHTRLGDGFQGWPEHAPFDKIIVTCSPQDVPAPLAAQLREGGRMLIPIGRRFEQELCTLVKQDGKLLVESREATYFVPMTGSADALRETGQGEPVTDLGQRRLRRAARPGQAGGLVLSAASQDHPRRSAQRDRPLHHVSQSRCRCALPGPAVDRRRRQPRGGACLLMPGPGQKTFEAAPDAAPRGGGQLVISFFDKDRKPVGEHPVMLWTGSFDWRRQSAHVVVPRRAMGATVAIGVLGATGQLACDQIDVRAARLRIAADR